MSNKSTRFESLSDVPPFNSLRGLDEFFRNFQRPSDGEQRMKMDVIENDRAYTVKAEIPGVKREDIKIDVHGNRVEISAEVKQEKEEKEGDRVVRSERSYGQVSRVFTLAHEIDDAEASATYQDGILELTLPKRGSGGGKKIPVN
ncbi:Hsp20/alpha crystallin family protein [Oxalobacteraceae bacterium OM1]|nr:Hsp20/alpha crystallin family protein [Oxalobacteraceae bacterium OM1]